MSAEHDVLDAVIVGAGLGGLCAAIQLREAGFERFVIVERAHEIGGTWRDNTYPGCACDVASHLYSYSFAPKRDWSRPFASQPEIQCYIVDLVQQQGLQAWIRFGANFAGAKWLGDQGIWEVQIKGQAPLLARHIITAQGPLNKPSLPEIEGRASFAGLQFHSSHWPEDLDLAGKRVAVVGTGASAIQIVPEVAKACAQLKVFQRTPAWLVPRGNTPFGPVLRWLFAHVPLVQRANRWRIYWLNEFITQSWLGNKWVRALVRWQAELQLKRQVRDEALRAQLTPSYEPGCKRMAVNDDFLPAMQLPHVQLVTQAISRVEPRGIVDAQGKLHEVDAIVWCTGFKITEFVAQGMRIEGEGGAELGHLTRTQSTATYLGIHAPQFPNLHFIVGPNTGLGSNSIIFMIECQVHYIVQALRASRALGHAPLRVKEEVVQSFYADVQQRMKRTVWASGCANYYTSTHLADGPRIDTLWPRHTTTYWWLTRRFQTHFYSDLGRKST